MFPEVMVVAAELVMMTAPPRPPATMCGTVARHVFHAPVRLTSIVVCHVSSVIARVADERLHPAEVTHVNDAPDDPDAERRHPFGGLLEVLLGRQRVGHGGDRGAGVERDDARALGREGQGVTAALAPGGARDDGDLAGEQSGHRHGRRTSKVTGRCSWVSTTPTADSTCAPGGMRRFVTRDSSSSKAISIWSRAKCMPMHRCGPRPKAACGLRSRSKLSWSACSNRDSSRLAEA